MARFIKVPAFHLYDEESGKWAAPEHWWLEGELIYQSDEIGEDGRPVLVCVPRRFCTDLSSIPRFPYFLRGVLRKNGRHRPAAVPHDYLCRLGLEFPRPLADAIFLEAMLLVGVRRWKARVMYLAVRINTERMIWFGKARRVRMEK